MRRRRKRGSSEDRVRERGLKMHVPRQPRRAPRQYRRQRVPGALSRRSAGRATAVASSARQTTPSSQMPAERTSCPAPDELSRARTQTRAGTGPPRSCAPPARSPAGRERRRAALDGTSQLSSARPATRRRNPARHSAARPGRERRSHRGRRAGSRSRTASNPFSNWPRCAGSSTPIASPSLIMPPPSRKKPGGV